MLEAEHARAVIGTRHRWVLALRNRRPHLCGLQEKTPPNRKRPAMDAAKPECGQTCRQDEA